MGPIHTPGFSSPALTTQDGSQRGTAELCIRAGLIHPPSFLSSALATQYGSLRGTAEVPLATLRVSRASGP